jgi:molybdopterin converting factor small subunit
MTATPAPGIVTLLLPAHLARYAGGRERVELPFRQGAPIAEYVRAVGVPGHEFYAVVRDGVVSSNLSAALSDGEVIQLLPVLSGG